MQTVDLLRQGAFVARLLKRLFDPFAATVSRAASSRTKFTSVSDRKGKKRRPGRHE
jgi:hypothetical protein